MATKLFTPPSLAPSDGNLPERRSQALRQLERIVVGPEMDKKETWLFVEHMTVEGGHLDAILAQRTDHRVHLFGGDHKITRYRCLAATCGLEVDNDGSAHGWRDRRAAFGNRVLARDRELIDATIDLSLHPDGLVQLVGVEFDFRCLGCLRYRGHKRCLAFG